MRKDVLHHLSVGDLVRLYPQGAHARPFGRIEHLELQGSRIRRHRHLAAEGVDLTDDDSLGRSADRRIARHLADILFSKCDQCGGVIQTGRRKCGFNARMSAADHEDLKIRHGLLHSEGIPSSPLPLRR